VAKRIDLSDDGLVYEWSGLEWELGGSAACGQRSVLDHHRAIADPAPAFPRPPANRLPGNVSVAVDYIEGEAMLLFMDMEGIQI